VGTVRVIGARHGVLLSSFSTAFQPSNISLPDSITVGSHNIPVFDSARNLGFIPESENFPRRNI